jgi:hypothetical protein
MSQTAQATSGKLAAERLSQREPDYQPPRPMSREDPAASDTAALGLLLIGLLQSTLPPRQRRRGWALAQAWAGEYVASRHSGVVVS